MFPDKRQKELLSQMTATGSVHVNCAKGQTKGVTLLMAFGWIKREKVHKWRKTYYLLTLTEIGRKGFEVKS